MLKHKTPPPPAFLLFPSSAPLRESKSSGSLKLNSPHKSSAPFNLFRPITGRKPSGRSVEGRRGGQGGLFQGRLFTGRFGSCREKRFFALVGREIKVTRSVHLQGSRKKSRVIYPVTINWFTPPDVLRVTLCNLAGLALNGSLGWGGTSRVSKQPMGDIGSATLTRAYNRRTIRSWRSVPQPKSFGIHISSTLLFSFPTHFYIAV